MYVVPSARRQVDVQATAILIELNNRSQSDLTQGNTVDSDYRQTHFAIEERKISRRNCSGQFLAGFGSVGIDFEKVVKRSNKWFCVIGRQLID
jgi:hypothetical protein